MTDQHPITPSHELIQQLRHEAPCGIHDAGATRELHLILAAYRAGADYELNAILALAKNPGDSDEDCYFDGFTVAGIRRNRRPKPPSLAEEALLAIDTAVADDRLSPAVAHAVRRALERLKGFENGEQHE